MAPPFYFKTSSGASPRRAFFYILSFVYQTKERTKEKFTSVVFLFPLKLPKNWEPRKPALLCKAKSRLFFQFFTKFFGKNKGDTFFLSWRIFKTSSGASPPWWLLHKKARLQRAFFLYSFFCLADKRKNVRKYKSRSYFVWLSCVRS